MKRYTNFDEIDRDIKFLRLKSNIDLEELKLGVHKGRETLVDTFSPINLIANTLGAIIKKTLVLKVVDKIIGIKPVKKKSYSSDEHL